MSEFARVLGAEAYALGPQPYQVQQVAAAALAELRRKREGVPTVVAPLIDPEAVRQREEAAHLKSLAQKLLAAAEVRAQASAATAEAEGIQIREKAKEEGFQEGFAQGRSEGQETGEKTGEEAGLARYTETVSRLQTLLENVQAEKQAYFVDREAVIVELALQVAAKVIVREVQTRSDHAANLLRQAIRKLADKSRLVVAVHPDDLERLTQARADGLLSLPGVKQVEFVADDKMVPGGVRVSSGALTLDASLDSQLAEICRGLLEEAYHEA